MRSRSSGSADPELTMTIRKSVVINEYGFDKVNPNDTVLTVKPLESSKKGNVTNPKVETGTSRLTYTSR